jgi:hypothetical protein
MTLPTLDAAEWESVVFTEHPRHDTIWAIIRGHDDQVYIGLCLEGTGGGVAQLYVYDTRGLRLRHLADLGKVTGEPPDSGHATQGKIHFALCHARDGKLYGATHCTTPPAGHRVWSPLSMWDDPRHCFPGGHIFRYDTLTGEALDFGVITPHDGIPYLMLDEERGRLYGATYPKAHLFSTDLSGRDVRDYGRISAMYPISMVFDGEGNLYTSDTSSGLVRFDVRRERVVHLGRWPYAEPWNPQRRCSWVTDMCLGPDGMIYGVTYSNDHLFRFDPRQEVPDVEDLGPGLDGVPGVSLRCLVADHSGNLYYTCQAQPNHPEGNVLVRYHVASRRKEPVGQFVLNGERYFPWRAVCDSAGHLYFACIHRVPTNILVYRPPPGA